MSSLNGLCIESDLSAHFSVSLHKVDVVVKTLEDFRKVYQNFQSLIWDLRPWNMNVPAQVLKVQNRLHLWQNSAEANPPHVVLWVAIGFDDPEGHKWQEKK